MFATCVCNMNGKKKKTMKNKKRKNFFFHHRQTTNERWHCRTVCPAHVGPNGPTAGAAPTTGLLRQPAGVVPVWRRPVRASHSSMLTTPFCRNNARFLWKRLKNADEETAAVWRIGQALWNRQYGEAHKAIHGFQWSAALAPQITSLEATLRARTAGLLAKAYTGISVSDTADHLGLDEQSTVVCTLMHQLAQQLTRMTQTHTALDGH